jgi:transcriptional regulator with GAF, ATPase, and Fis domain
MKTPSQTFVVPAKATEHTLIKKKATILILSGPQQGKEIIIESTPFSIGSSDSCDLQLQDTAVSRKHCIINSDGHTFSIQDTNSTNGSFLCELRIMHAYLTPGSELRLGNTRLLFSPALELADIPLSQNNHFGSAIGASDAMRRIFYLAESYAPTDATIMLTGETGTGKEIFAEEIHKHSKRADKPFVVIDCTSISRDIVESELFGHIKGAFTGATSDRPGAFESADGGTVFLDEIGELPQELQPKLLRVLEKREIKRVGSNEVRKIDVRIICATNRNIQKEINDGNFREDLYYRLSVVNIELPPLREHKEDIPLLAETFMNRLHNANAHDEIQDFDNAMKALMRYDWPGNIRELRNLVDRAYYHIQKPVDILMCQQGDIFLKQTCSAQNSNEENSSSNSVDTTKPFKDEKNRLIDDFERQYIKELLARNNGNVSKSAREADIERAYLQRLIKKYGLNT